MSRKTEFEATDGGEITLVVTNAEKKTVETWAEEKGLLPQIENLSGRGIPNPEFWRFAAAKAFCGWPVGRELTEKDFNEAVIAACNQTIR